VTLTARVSRGEGAARTDTAVAASRKRFLIATILDVVRTILTMFSNLVATSERTQQLLYLTLLVQDMGLSRRCVFVSCAPQMMLDEHPCMER
jgi:hypothetical protein